MTARSYLLSVLFLTSMAGVARSAAVPAKTGQQIYQSACVQCHGPMGEGVAGKSDEALHGDRSLDSLMRVIQRTMPEDKPKSLSHEESALVAQYIYDAFYSNAARARMRPARIELSRLTNAQYRNSIADLVATFRGPVEAVEPGGLAAQYFNSRRSQQDKKVIDRVDPTVSFVFENATPDSKLLPGPEHFIRWRGSLIAEETGEYEIIARTENGVRLWLNDDRKTLIDGWVSSGKEPREQKASIYLLGGRAYPIRVETFRSKDKSASIALMWKPPHKVAQVVPAKNLSPKSAAETLVVGTQFPPDDASSGYERGISVSKGWHQATTNAAIEAAGKVVDQLDAFSKSKAGDKDRAEKVKAFVAAFAERAFRRPLSADEKALFVEAPFKDAKDAETGAKRAVLLILKSPRFLYPELPGAKPDGYTVATRLALNLWDSLPDKPLLEAAAQGKLSTEPQVAAHARRMLADPRAKSKVKEFLHDWLETDHAEEISKDPTAFPGFDEALLADLRTSLDAFLDAVVWDKGSDYRQLLLADYVFLNERLAKFYGVTLPSSAAAGAFAKVQFDPKQRSGVLTHPFLLSSLAYHRNSSPIHRGVFLTRNIVGRALKPPPMAIEFMDDRFDPSLTMREKVTELTRSNACMSCHSVINPLGFSLESFDAVGRFRTTDNNKPVDTSSELEIGNGKSIKLTGPRDVAEYAATSAEAHRAFIRQLFDHQGKQPADAYGPQTLERLRTRFVGSNYNIQELLVEIAKTSALHGVKQP